VLCSLLVYTNVLKEHAASIIKVDVKTQQHIPLKFWCISNRLITKVARRYPTPSLWHAEIHVGVHIKCLLLLFSFKQK
jgi:hypothetical protein